MTSPVDVVTRYLASFSGSDPDATAGFVSEGFRNEHLSALGSDCVGREEYRRRLPHFFEMLTDRSYSIDDMVELPREGVTDVIVRYRFSATYESHRIDIPGVMWFSVRDDRIVRRVDVWDSLAFLQQTDQAGA